MSMVSNPTASDGFFSRLVTSAETALNKVVAESLPNWVNAQVAKQSANQLAQPTFDPTTAPPRVDGWLYAQQIPGGGISYGVDPRPRPAMFGGLSDYTLLLAAGAIGVIILLAMRKK